MDVKLKRKDDKSVLVELGHVIISMPQDAVKQLVDLMDYRVKQLTPEDEASLERSLAGYRKIALRIVDMENATVQMMLADLTTKQVIILVRIDNSGRVKEKILKNLPSIKRQELEEDLKLNEKITVKKALSQMEYKIVPVLKRAIMERKRIMSEG
ncbi:FliG C-terminal domain-containing protein [Thiomicrospira sp. ALE5]|uniref:FliG C-terminal domain-containing protein n=1 Tax=Thiomicrospira sp. ALE5 TaxID=748650 RepID=UPI0008EC0812|nr:FliG C-terminal domain-containing protein [Thiomicrospira sp. ALE5]SFR56445.1 FliG C-terminal domain-containing protein [Thiomicrospira sp. ALE5]